MWLIVFGIFLIVIAWLLDRVRFAMFGRRDARHDNVRNFYRGAPPNRRPRR
jgi:hypothetical protein